MNNIKNNIDIEVKKEQKKQNAKTVMRLFHKSKTGYKIMLISTKDEKIYFTIIDDKKDKQNIALSIEECSTLRDVLDVFIKKNISKKM